MNRYCNVCMGIAISLCVTTAPAWAADAESTHAREMPAVAAGTAVTAMATVEAIDLDTREVTLRKEDQSIVTIIAGEEVRNLAQVEVGDRVITTYEVGLIMALSEPDTTIRERTDTLEMGRAEPGQKPAINIRETVKATGFVTAVDAENRMVTLKGAERTVTLPVAEDIDLLSIKVGDQVNAIYRQTLAISVVSTPTPAAGRPTPEADQ